MNKTSKNILKFLGWFLGILIILLIGTGLLVYFKAESYIHKYLSDFVNEKSGNLYQLNYDNLNISTKPLSVTLSNINLSPDKEQRETIEKANPGKTFYTFYSPELKLIDLKPLKLIKEKEFYCKKITVQQPDFSISGEGLLQEKSEKNMSNLIQELQPLFFKRLKTVLVEEIQFIDANYKLYQSFNDLKQISNAQKISMEISNFQTDSALLFSGNNYFKSDDILISINAFENSLSDSLHFLNIEKLRYSLKTTDIFAEGFHLFHKEKDSTKNLYNVVVPKLHLKSKNLSGFSLGDSLDIQYLQFENPKISFHQKENKRELAIEDINQFDLYSLIENQFDEIKIDSFIFANANLEIFQQPETEKYQQQFESLSIQLTGFLLDSTSAQNKQKLFHADDIDMNVQGYHLRLDDKQHSFNADTLSVSTSTNTLGIGNIRILPNENSQNTSRTLVNVDCQSLNIDNVNLKTLYHTRKLPTRRINITEPKVQLQYQTDIEQNKNKKEFGLLFNLVSAYLYGVYSEVVEINNGRLNIESLEQNKVQGYFETDFNFSLSGFALDSASIQQTDKFFYANNFDIQFDNYQMKLVDNLHKINAERIAIQSFDRKLQIDNLSLKPEIKKISLAAMQKFKRSELYNITVPTITLWGINLREAFFYNRLNISRFHVSRPKIYFENFGLLRQNKDKKKFSELSQLLFNYLYEINIEELSIPQGDFKWINHTKKGRTTSFDNEFAATLKGFLLNEEELKKQRIFYSDNFELSVKDQIFQLSDSVHILQAGEINLSSEKSSIDIKNALLYPLINSPKYDQLSTTFQVSIPELQVSAFDFLKAYKSKELQLNSIELNRPNFKIYTKKGFSKSLDFNKFSVPFPSFVKSIQLDEFKITNGDIINYEVAGNKHTAKSNFLLHFSLPDINLTRGTDNQTKVSTGKVKLMLKDFNTPLGDLHELKIRELNYDQNKKDINIQDLKVNAFGSKVSDNRFSISTPEIQFTGFELEKAIKDNDFEFQQIELSRPQVKIEINDSIKENKFELAKNLDLFPYVEPYLDKIKIDRFYLKEVNLNLDWFHKELVNRNFNIDFKNIYIASDSRKSNLLNSDEFEITTTNLSTQSKNAYYNFSIDTAVYNSAKHKLVFKNAAITPLLSTIEFHKKIRYQTDYLQVKTNKIEINGIDENEWFKNNIIKAKSLNIGNTELDIYRNKRIPFNTNQRPPWPQDLLKSIEQPFIFDSVFLASSVINYKELLEFNDEPGFIQFTDLKLKTGMTTNQLNYIRLNPNLIVEASAKLYDQALLNVDVNFNLSSPNHIHNVKGSLYPIDLKYFNNMLEKSTPVSIASGQLKRFDFDINLDDKIATGQLLLAFDNFKVSILAYNMDGTRRSRFASFWANNMVLSSENPKGDRELLPTQITYEKDIQRSIINFWWKAIFSGSKKTIGIKDEPAN